METVGVRDLRQHLSRYLRRVADGERLVVTERRRPVAMLGPLPQEEDIHDFLIAIGEVSPATRDLLDLQPPVRVEGPSTEEIFDELRADRI